MRRHRVLDFKLQIGSLRLEYDRAYGPEKRRGWSVVRDGSFFCQHKPFWLAMREIWRIVRGHYRGNK